MNDSFSIIRLAATSSTNIFAQNYAISHPKVKKFIVIAEEQTKGKGQRGNKWFGDKNKNLLFSVVMQDINYSPKEIFTINMMVSLALHETVSNYIEKLKIKWPNDLYSGDKKIAGILIENSVRGQNISQTVIGIGINVNQAIFPDNLPNAGSILTESRKEQDREQILTLFISKFEKYWIKKPNFAFLKKNYLDKLMGFHSFLSYRDKQGLFLGKIIDIEQNGQLVLSDDSSRIRKFYFKEIELIN